MTNFNENTIMNQKGEKQLSQTYETSKLVAHNKNKTIHLFGHNSTLVTSNGNVKFGKNRVDFVGTVDQAIREHKTFTALTKMPAKVLITLFENGWIEKKLTSNNKDSNAVLSFHKNAERVKAVVAKRSEVGLLWTDANSGGLNWSKLSPTVVVNRFPRDANAVLNLCSQALIGKPNLDCHYPRTYPLNQVHGAFFDDYSLTACVSLLRAYINGDVICHKNGKVPLSVLIFAIKQCLKYISNKEYTGNNAELKIFFENYYKIIHEGQYITDFSEEQKVNGSKANIMTLIQQLLPKLIVLRPQTAIDGYRNIWIVKSKTNSNHRPFLLNKIESILKKCTQIDDNNFIIQKYIETPLLIENAKFNILTWFEISTLDDCLTIWVYQKYCMQFYLRKFSLDIDHPKNDHFTNLRPSYNASLTPMEICNVKQLKSTLSSKGAIKNNNSDICLKIKNAIVSSVLASVGILNLRPNCYETFKATFVVDNNLNPWLIDIKSDPFLTKYNFSHPMSSIKEGVEKSLVKFLVIKNRVLQTRIGMFDLIHKSSIPGNYIPRAFVKINVEKCNKTKIKKDKNLHEKFSHFDIDAVNTYASSIQENFMEHFYPRTLKLNFNSKITDSENALRYLQENKLCLTELKESMARIKTGSKINEHRSHHCLELLDQWKTRVLTMKTFYKIIQTKEIENK